MRNIPELADAIADEVIGNRMPWIDNDEWAGQVCREAYRLLMPGGIVRFHATTGNGNVCQSWLEQAGFQNVRIIGNHAVGEKP